MKRLFFLYFLLCGFIAKAQILSAIRNQTNAYQLGGFSLSGGTYKLLNMPLTTSTTDKAVTVNSSGNMRTNALSLQFVMNGGTTSTLGATFNGITVDKASPALGVLIDMTGTTSSTSFREYKMRADNGGGYFSGGYFGTLFNAQRITYSYLSVPDSSTASSYLTTLVRLYPYNQVVIGNTAPSFLGGRLQVQGTVTADTIKMRVKRSSTTGDSILMWNPADSSFRVKSPSATATPSFLDVTGVGDTTNKAIEITGNGFSTVKTHGLFLGYDATNNRAQVYNYNHATGLYGNIILNASGGGLVGIGKTSPAEALDVNGNIVASAPSYSSGGYETVVRNSTSGRFETIIGTQTGFATTTDADYTVQATDKFIVLIQTTSLRTLTLPNPVGAAGRELWIRCAATGSGQWQTGTTGWIGCGQIGTPPFSPASNIAFSSNTTFHIASDGTSWYCLQ